MDTDARIAAAIAKSRRNADQLRPGDRIIRGAGMQYGWTVAAVDVDGDWTVIRFTNKKVVYLLTDRNTLIHVVTN